MLFILFDNFEEDKDKTIPRPEARRKRPHVMPLT